MAGSEPVPGAVRAFLARASLDDLVDVLLLPTVSQDVEISLADNKAVAVIEDHEALARHTDLLERKLKYAKPRKAASEFLSSIFSMSYSPEGMPGEFRYGLFDWMGSSEAELTPIYIVRKNHVRDEALCRFVRAFRAIPPARRPKVVFDAEHAIPEARTLLAFAKDCVRAFIPAHGGIRSMSVAAVHASLERFPDALMSGGLSTCINIHLDAPDARAPIREQRRYAMFLYQRVQANKGCDHRFNASNDVRCLEAFLRQKLSTSSLSSDQKAWFGEALLFTLLDRSYVLEEGPTPVENALGIAKELGDTDLEAWALRHINISAGVTPFASELLDRAAQRLQQAGRFTQSAYASTNKVVTDLHRIDRTPDLGHAEATVEYVLDWAPYSERLSSIINAAGAAALLSGQLNKAERHFAHAAEANGGRLHQISALINGAIARHVGGSPASEGEILAIFRAIVASKMAAKLDYHHVYLLANLIALAPSEGLKRELRRHLLDASYMDYDRDTVLNDRLLDYLATKFTMIADGHRFRGKRGQFVEQHGLLPLAQFIWN